MRRGRYVRRAAHIRRFRRCVWFPVLIAIVAIQLPGGAGWAQPDSYNKIMLVREFERFNASVKEGKGYSEYDNSASLAWGESYYLNAYIKMYRSTGDTKWLDTVVAHFDRMVANMSDPDGDRVLSWHTDRYSTSWIRTFVLHNQGTAEISPDEAREYNIERAHEAVDGEFSIEYLANNRYEVRDLLLNRRVHYGSFTSGQVIEGIPGFDVVITGTLVEGDKFRVQTQAPPPLEYAVHEGMIVYPIAQFIELALRVDGLKAQYRTKAESYLKLIEDRVLAKQERYWVQLAEDRGAYRSTAVAWERYPNRVLPHNQYLALGRAYLVLQAVSDNPLFRMRAREMAKFFEASLHVTGRAYTWSYWNWTEAGEARSSGTEDTSHGHIDIEFVVEAWRRGVVFDDQDMLGFARTLTDLMWNGSLSDPTVGSRVDQQSGEGKAIRGWVELCRWDERIWDLHWALFNKLGRPGLDIPHLLHLREVIDGQDAYLVSPRSGSSGGPASAIHSLSLDLDSADTDQALTALTGVSEGWAFALQLYGNGLLDAVSYTVTLEYDEAQLTLVYYENGEVFTRGLAETAQDSSLITVRSDTLAQGTTLDGGLLGTFRFQTRPGFKDATIRITASTVDRADGVEASGGGADARLSALVCDFDASGDVGFADFLQLARGYGAFQGAENYEPKLDLDGDGLIDFADFLLFARNYGTGVASSG